MRLVNGYKMWNTCYLLNILVRGRGVEPPWIAPLAPKASASTISPPAPIQASLYQAALKLAENNTLDI